MSTINPISLNLSQFFASSATVKPPILPKTEASIPTSPYRCIFQTEPQLRVQFAKFLNTIFFQLDEKKVFALIDAILADPHKSDEQIYKELIAKIDTAKKSYPLLSQLWALSVLKKGMGEQASSILASFNGSKINDYLEVYDRRYVKTLQKMANLSLKGQKIAFCDADKVTLSTRIESGSLLARYPYTRHICLNQADCTNPLEQTEKTYLPLSADRVSESSLDCIACLGGLHHVPSSHQEAFVASLSNAMRPGGVLLFRDHDVVNDHLKAIASVVHSFVNASDKVSWDIESKEIRDFKSIDDWTGLFQKHGFIPITSDKKVLKDDPTENAMVAFIKAPGNVEELEKAAVLRKNFIQAPEASRSTWIEWGNVRYSQRYAEFIQDHHAYAFDYIGHLKQHWIHYKNYIKECRKNPLISFSDLFFSENGITALFILLTASVQLSMNYITSLPSQLIARIRFGSKWREVVNLTTLEKFQAKTEKEYASFIVHTPYFQFPWLQTMRNMWQCIWQSKESIGVKLSNSICAIVPSLGYLTTAVIAFVSKMVFGASFEQERRIEMIIQDPQNCLNQIQQDNPDLKIEVVLQTTDKAKLICLPRYMPMTNFIKKMSQYDSMKIVSIANNKSAPIDLLLSSGDQLQQIQGASMVYEMPVLQDPDNKRYAHYDVEVSSILEFIKASTTEKVLYVHE